MTRQIVRRHHLDEVLKRRQGVTKVVLGMKSNYFAPVVPHVVNRVAEWDATRSGFSALQLRVK